ncbi:hypothetical protein GJ496_000434 [Pomphorhynchus laevis]|nr:hypothetical protein GJ496_000434 [Pomphorhynchus laevis]
MANDVSKRTIQPSVTGTSLIAFIYDKGVIVAADTLGSYGSLARFRSCERVFKINDTVLFAGSGDIADIQNLHGEIELMSVENDCAQDGHKLTPKSLFNWLSTKLYRSRSEFNPLLIGGIVAGMEDGEPFIGCVNDVGAAYQESIVTRGMGSRLILPWIRMQISMLGRLPNRQESEELINQAMTLLYYRDCRAFPRYTLGVIDSSGELLIQHALCKDNWQMMNYAKIPVQT